MAKVNLAKIDEDYDPFLEDTTNAEEFPSDVHHSDVFKLSYTPLTCYISLEDNLIDLIQANSQCALFSSNEMTALVGLHTCGDLASVILNQFIENDIIKALSVVGCCYHQITSK